SARPGMSPVNRQQPGLRLYPERDQLAAGDPAELLWIVYEEPVLALAVGGKHWYKSPLVGWAVPDGRAVQDAAGLPGGQGEPQHIHAVPGHPGVLALPRRRTRRCCGQGGSVRAGEGGVHADGAVVDLAEQQVAVSLQ